MNQGIIQATDFSGWLFQQSAIVILVVLVMIGFYRYILPRMEKQQEKYEEALKEQIADARQRSDMRDQAYLSGLKEQTDAIRQVSQRMEDLSDEIKGARRVRSKDG